MIRSSWMANRTLAGLGKANDHPLITGTTSQRAVLWGFRGPIRAAWNQGYFRIADKDTRTQTYAKEALNVTAMKAERWCSTPDFQTRRS